MSKYILESICHFGLFSKIQLQRHATGFCQATHDRFSHNKLNAHTKIAFPLCFNVKTCITRRVPFWQNLSFFIVIQLLHIWLLELSHWITNYECTSHILLQALSCDKLNSSHWGYAGETLTRVKKSSESYALLHSNKPSGKLLSMM